jgi:hypothetical protein
MSSRSQKTKCSQDECKQILPSLLLFRYECPGCKLAFCDKHLDWKRGHCCSALEAMELKHRQRLESTLPQVKHPKINKI